MAGIYTSKTPPVSEGGNEPLILILLGPPGSGKGTHAPALSKYLKIPHISTGDLFRENIRNETPIGKIAKGYIDAGILVPDKVVLDMLVLRLKEVDCKRGAILDGFPRTIVQAEALDQHLGSSTHLSVLLFQIDKDILIERICGRIACKKCGRPYHKKYDPPKQLNICDSCHGAIYQRSDDSEEVLQKRLEVYREQTEPLVQYYRTKSDVLHEINASQSKTEVFNEMIKTLSIEPSYIY